MYFDINMAAMPEKLNSLKEYLMEAGKKESISDIQCGIEVIDGRKILYAAKEEKFYQLDTMYDQDTNLDLWYYGMDPRFNSKFFMFGLGNGMYINKIMQETEEDTTFYVYEPDESILLKALHEFDLSNMLSSGRVYIMFPKIEKNDNAFYNYLADITDYTDVQGARNCIYPNYNLLFPEAYKVYDDTIQELMDSLQANRQVLENFGKSYIKNTFINAPYMCYGKSVEHLWSMLNKDIPVIIVSSGPSLTKNVEEIKKAKGKALIVSADSAISVLLNHDIVPDLYVCVDSKKHEKHFTNPLVKDIPVVCMLHTSVPAIREHNAPCFFVNDMNPHVGDFIIENMITIPMLASGGSVANIAMNFCEMMGLKTFILAGQDLAYTNNKTHAEGSLRSTWNIDIDYSKCYVEGQDGEQILSSNEFKLYKDWFEREIVEHPDITVINGTEGGAKIHGAIQTTLREAIEKYCTIEYDISSILNNTRYLMSTEERKKFREFITETPANIKEIVTLSQKGISIFEKMEMLIREDKYQSQKFLTYYKQTEEIINELQSNSAIYYPECIMQKEVGEYLKQAYDLEDNERTELTTAVRQGKEYLELVKEKANQIMPEIAEYCSVSESLYDAFEEKCQTDREFKDDDLQMMWEQLLKFISPEMEQADFLNLYAVLEELESYKDKEEFENLINRQFRAACEVRMEHALYKAAIFAYLVSTYPDNGEYVSAMENLCKTNTLLRKRHVNFLYDIMNEINQEKAVVMQEKVLGKCMDILKED